MIYTSTLCICFSGCHFFFFLSFIFLLVFSLSDLVTLKVNAFNWTKICGQEGRNFVRLLIHWPAVSLSPCWQLCLVVAIRCVRTLRRYIYFSLPWLPHCHLLICRLVRFYILNFSCEWIVNVVSAKKFSVFFSLSGGIFFLLSYKNVSRYHLNHDWFS